MMPTVTVSSHLGSVLVAQEVSLGYARDGNPWPNTNARFYHNFLTYILHESNIFNEARKVPMTINDDDKTTNQRTTILVILII